MAAVERIQKYLSACGIASRRKSEELILAGKVRVNGHVATLGDKIDPKRDTITVSGKRVVRQKHFTYLMLNKPRGFITTMQDERERKCVASLVENAPAHVFPVGRLDKDSEGLLLFTNDGDFANALTHPSKHVPKTYRVTVRPSVSETQLTALTQGVIIDERKTAPAEVRVITSEENRVVLEIILYEGRNRQIRKMCEQVGLQVARLRRIAIGSVKLGMLKTGDWRELTEDEVRRLELAAGMERAKKT
ncbi:MAG: rRNA pseudouridine synthase [Clostridia bacterium]|nr:rRNA pseudouridine synthase [Clostridia bacterium]